MPPGWSALRQAILERDGHRCTRITDDGRCANLACEVDHVTPHHQGGSDDPSNLASLCPYHHAEKTKHETAAARWRYRSTRAPEQHPGLT